MKLSGPYGTGLRIALYNIAALLLTLILSVTLFGKGSSYRTWPFVEKIFAGLWVVLTFPTQFFHYEYKTTTGGGWIDFWFLSPFIWGVTAFAIHKLVMRGRKT